jgi:hypothetical protein
MILHFREALMAENDKPLSTLIAQGWELVNYAMGHDATEGAGVHCFVLRKQKQHRILKVRPKMFGKGYVVKEMDI